MHLNREKVDHLTGDQLNCFTNLPDLCGPYDAGCKVKVRLMNTRTSMSPWLFLAAILLRNFRLYFELRNVGVGL